jgi:hypothetical protein
VTVASLNEVVMLSPHYSTSRSGYNLATFHTTQGAEKIRDLGGWFQNPAAQCSSHHGADNYERGVFGAYVYENHAAWTQAGANPYCLSIELCGFAEWTREQWLNDKAVLVDNAAEWLAYVVGKYSIPWTLLNHAQAQTPGARGIVQHLHFGAWGGGHWDCGEDEFPIDVILDKAKHWGGGTTTPPPAAGGSVMTAASAYDSDGRLHHAAIDQHGDVCYKGPDGNWYPISREEWHKAQSGVGMVIGGPEDTITITWTQRDGDAVHMWQKGVGQGGPWRITRLGASYQ